MNHSAARSEPVIEVASKRWRVILDMLKREGLARHHIDSYDDFIERVLPRIVSELGEVKIENPSGHYTIRFGKVEFRKPSIIEASGTGGVTTTPLETRIRNANYSAPMMVHTEIVECDDGEETVKDSGPVYIGNMPVMIKSKLCMLRNHSQDELIDAGEDPNDPGGYFVINGSERIITGVEDVPINKIMLGRETIGDKTTYTGTVHSGDAGFRSKLSLVMYEGMIRVRFGSSPTDIPLVILMRALGAGSDVDIASAISEREAVREVLDFSFDVGTMAQTESDAIHYIGRRKAPGMEDTYQNAQTDYVIDSILPHLGRTPQDRSKKVTFLGEMACRLVEMSLGWLEPDDRDHYGNKNVKFGGSLLSEIFRKAFHNMTRDIKYHLEKSYWNRRSVNSVGAAVRPGIITDRINNSIATGNWGDGRAGVTQMLDRTNYLSCISHLRRIQSPLSRDQPHYLARDLHPTHFGRVCPSETPEGSNCGLVKNMALGGLVSLYSDPEKVLEVIWSMFVVSVGEADKNMRKNWARIILDGMIVGFCEDGVELAGSLRRARRESVLHPHVGVYLQEPNESDGTVRVHVDTVPGRLLHPLIILYDGESSLTDEMLEKVASSEVSWRDLIGMGVIELIDAKEEENCFVSLDGVETVGRTHMEIFTSSILGVGPSQIPYPEHNQSPRITYGAAMAKQGLGFSTPTLRTSTYVRQHVMLYPQVPMVDTKSMKAIGMEGRPAGMNCVVAVLPFDGYNIEDAIVMNRASVERGLGRSFFYRVYKGEAKHYLGGVRDQFTLPRMKDRINGFRGEHAYRFLEGDGVASVESSLSEGEAVIGRISPPRFMEPDADQYFVPGKRDTSVVVRPSEKGVIDTVLMTDSGDGHRMFKVRVRDMRVPEIGDKFASRHGQKGVCGILANAEDLPYTEDGISPDILINPHAFPSRMTVGMLLESICGKAASFRGRMVDGSPFHGEKLEDVKSVLEEVGFQYSGKEKMYDGRTGKAFPVETFIGVVYYQRLQHMVADKIHARARGSIQMISRQPTEGRARGGGLRFGEMERDCIIAYGGSMLLRDRMLDESDMTEVEVCRRCGILAHQDNVTRKGVCRICDDLGEICVVKVAYGFKLLLQEMMGLGIAPRLIIKDHV